MSIKYKRLVTTQHSLGTPDTNLSGLSTLKVRKVERSRPLCFPWVSSSDFGINMGRNPETTTMKSMMFQAFLR